MAHTVRVIVRFSGVLLLAILAGLLGGAPVDAAARSAVVQDGAARFTVLTPTLIRAEFAQDGRFEDRPTMTAQRVRRPVPRYTTRVRGGWREIRTAGVLLRWRRGTAQLDAETLRLTFGTGGRRTTAGMNPTAQQRILGGWTRALDLLQGPVPLNPGVLTRDGWRVVDDSRTILLVPQAPGFATRPAREGTYQDWYLFGYGDDRARALRDLRTLTGAAPLLDRSAFGVWYSKYFPYSASELQEIAGEFARRRIPLSMVSLDTDFKRQADPVGAALGAQLAGAPGLPYSWNAWDWNRDLFPDPKAFVDWAHREGIDVGANIHPSINSNDPALPAVEARTGPLGTDDGMCRLLQADLTGQCKVFDWTKQAHLDAYFALHEPFADTGIDMFWLDWCCEAPNSAVAPGLTADTWINTRYAAYQRARGERWPAFSRIGASFLPDGVYGDRQQPDGGVGALAEHRATVQFTGDTCASWEMLAFEAEMTAGAAAIGLPYVSHDIGSFAGLPIAGQCNGVIAGQNNVVPADLYARWVQFATFEPLDRLHSHHGKRLPWEYPGPAGDAAAEALRLRAALVPTTYTLARRAHDTGLPITGPLWLTWPREEGAHENPTVRTFGPDIVVASVAAPGDPAQTRLWVPPGTWVDWFTGERSRGPAQRTVSVPLSRMPVLVRAGAVVVTDPSGERAAPAPALLRIDAFRGSRGRFTLYEDAGEGYAFERGQAMRTTITQRRAGRRTTVTVGRARGRFAGAPSRRSFEVRLRDVARPRTVQVDGRRVPASRLSYEAASRTLVVRTGARSTRRAVTIVATG